VTDTPNTQASDAPRLLHEIIARQARSNPGATALRCGEQALDYRALQTNIGRLASRIAAAGKPGERIALLAWNCIEFVELIYAIPAAGRILVPLNARLAPAELAYQLSHSGARTLVGDPDLLAPLLQHTDCPPDLEVIALGEQYEHWRDSAEDTVLPPVQADDAVWILFTSGSTGRPKGAVLTHQSFLAGLESAALGRPVLPGDRYYYPFPLFHVAAHNVLLQHLYGAQVVLARSFNAADTLAACRELRITTLSLAPTMIAMMMNEADFSVQDLDSVRTIGYGASAMPLTLLERLLNETEVGLCQSYGMTELSGSVAFLTVEDHRAAAQGAAHLLQSVGRPLPTAEIKLAGDDGGPVPAGDSGEILVRAHQCMAGYWRDEANTADTIVDGWLHTGDIGRFDQDGYLYIVDRKKDMILSGGENIASREVEEVLRQHPAINDCAVIGLPDERWGEVPCAVLITTTAVDDDVLAGFCREHLAGYKTPKHWFRLEQLPLNASGKVDKPRLRRELAAS